MQMQTDIFFKVSDGIMGNYIKKTNFFAVFILLITLGCNVKPADQVLTTFYTEDSVYKVTFSKPTELDTFYSWKDIGDNQCDDKSKYRFTKRSFQLQKETGDFFRVKGDSTYWLTFYHICHYECKIHQGREYWDTPKELLMQIVESTKNKGLPIDTFFAKKTTINERLFYLCAYKSCDWNKEVNGAFYSRLLGYTCIDKNQFFIEADCRSSICDGFIERMEKSIRTIRIERNKYK